MEETLSTEHMPPVPATPIAAAHGHCPACGSPVAADQRYCLECGERQVPRSTFLMGSPAAASGQRPPAAPATAAQLADGGSRNSTLAALAGIGLLLLAMGIGVLIGRAGNSKSGVPQTQVITVAGAGGAAASGTSAAATEATFTSDWPSGTTGYTVQLQTLPVSGTAVSAVEAAKSSATGKGAASVGALKSSEFSSLTSGDYVIYSGQYKTKAEAEKALKALTKSFPAAKVVEVSSKEAGSAGSGSAAKETGAGTAEGENIEKPASVKSLKTKGKSGKSYEESLKEEPEVVTTGKG